MKKNSKEDYFKARDIRLTLSKSDLDILLYAFYHVDWSEYDEQDFCGEDSSCACIHLDDIEYQLNYAFNRVLN